MNQIQYIFWKFRLFSVHFLCIFCEIQYIYHTFMHRISIFYRKFQYIFWISFSVCFQYIFSTYSAKIFHRVERDIRFTNDDDEKENLKFEYKNHKTDAEWERSHYTDIIEKSKND